MKSLFDWLGQLGCWGVLLVALALVAGCTVIVQALPPYGCPA